MKQVKQQVSIVLDHVDRPKRNFRSVFTVREVTYGLVERLDTGDLELRAVFFQEADGTTTMALDFLVPDPSQTNYIRFTHLPPDRILTELQEKPFSQQRWYDVLNQFKGVYGPWPNQEQVSGSTRSSWRGR